MPRPDSPATGTRALRALVPLAIVLAAPLVPADEPGEGPARAETADRGGWVTQTVQAPGVTHHTFESAAVQARVSYHLYTPRLYDREPGRRFPVVYWLHGSGGGLRGIPEVARHFDAAIESGQAPPLLVVFVNGLVEGMYVDWRDGSTPVETMIVEDLVPHVDATHRTIATRAGRMLDGFSMGGYGAARLGFKFPELFGAVSIVGAGPLQPDLLRDAPRAGGRRAQEVLDRVYGGDQAHFFAVSPRALAERNAETIAADSRVRLVIGADDETFANNRDFHEHLDALGIPHTWTVLPGVGHDPAGVLAALGADTWEFHRAAFAADATRAHDVEQPDREIRLRIADHDRRAVIVNAAADGVRRPAVIVLHGGMGSAARIRTGSGFDDVARKHRFMVVYGEGTEFRDGMHGWNTGFLLRRQVRDADDIAYLDAVIDTVIRDHGADPERIFMTGASNGGMMTFIYGLARPRRLAAIAPVVATMFSFDTAPDVPLPVLVINGAKDREVPLEGGMSSNALVRRAQAAPFKPVREVVDFWVKVNQSKPEGDAVVDGTVTTTTYAAGPGGAVTEFVLDAAGGHGWPGSPPRWMGGAPITAFHGADRVWRFFADKSRPRRD
jgi:poly(3-hydroxybutyrate) depolymerase